MLFASFLFSYESCISEISLLLQWPGYELKDYASIPGNGRVLDPSCCARAGLGAHPALYATGTRYSL